MSDDAPILGAIVVGLPADVFKRGLVNRTGQTIAQGDVVCLDTDSAHPRSVIFSSSHGQLNPHVALSAAITLATVDVASGDEATVNVLTAVGVVPGDTLVASSTPRYATVDNAQPDGRAVLGVSLTTKTAGVPGTVQVAVRSSGSAGTGLVETRGRGGAVGTHPSTQFLGVYASNDAPNGRSVVDLKRYNLWEFRSYVVGDPDSDAGDWSPAWAALFAKIILEQRAATGAVIEIPPKTTNYYHSLDIDIERPHYIKALGVAGNAPPGVRLSFAVGKGVNVWGYNSPSGEAAQGAILEGFAIQSLGQQIGRHGVHAYTDCKLRGLHVSFFDTGIMVQTGLPNTNANDFTITSCVVTACRKGIHLIGGDTNTFTISFCTTFVCTVRDVLDESFLGGTWFRVHSEGSTAPISWEVVPVGLGSHVFDCYSECVGPSRFVSPSFVSGPGLWAGGFTDDSNVMYVANESRGIQFVGKGTPSNYPGDGPFTVRKQIGHAFSVPQTWVERLTVEGPGVDPYQIDQDSFGDAAGFRKSFADWYGGPGNPIKVRHVSVSMVDAWPMSCARILAGSSYEARDRWPMGFGIGQNKIVPAPIGVTADPTTDTWNPGDVWILGDGGASGWWAKLCTVMGSQFAYTDGRTATADNSNVIVLSGSNSQLIIGDVISVAGGTRRRITGISGTTLTLSGTVNAGSGLSIATAPATFKRFGALEP